MSTRDATRTPDAGTRTDASTPGRTLLLLAVAICTSLAASGCAHLKDWAHNGFKVGPNYAQPAAPIANEWIDFNDPRVISDTHGVNDVAWWTALNDPHVDQLVQSAYLQNLTLQEAGLRVMEFQAHRAFAVGNLFPQSQTGFGQFQWLNFSQAGNTLGIPPDLAAMGFPVNIPPVAISNWQGGFNASWELDVWGKYRRAIEQRDADLDAAVEHYDDVLVILLADTAAQYVRVREAQQRLRYARANVEAQRGSLTIAEARFRNGAVSELDVTQAKSNLGQTEALIPKLEFEQRQANNLLCVLLGIPPRDLTPQLGDAPIPSPASSVVVGIPADLLRRRPDVRFAEREAAARSAIIGIAVADLFPEFRINGTMSWQANNFQDLWSADAFGGNIGPRFDWNILNYGRIVSNIDVQEARFQQKAVAYQNTVLKANAETETAITSFLKSQERVRSLRYGVEASQRSVELAETQYKEGATDFNRVFNLQSALTTQQDQLARAEADVALSLIGIYRNLGGGWQIRLSELDHGPALPMLDDPAATGLPLRSDAEPLPAPQPPEAEPAAE